MFAVRAGICALIMLSFAAQAEISDQEVKEACAKVPEHARNGEQA